MYMPNLYQFDACNLVQNKDLVATVLPIRLTTCNDFDGGKDTNDLFYFQSLNYNQYERFGLRAGQYPISSKE